MGNVPALPGQAGTRRIQALGSTIREGHLWGCHMGWRNGGDSWSGDVVVGWSGLGVAEERGKGLVVATNTGRG